MISEAWIRNEFRGVKQERKWGTSKDILLSDQVVFKQKSENKENTKGFKCEMWPRFLVWYKHGYFNCVIMNGMKKIKTSVFGQ